MGQEVKEMWVWLQGVLWASLLGKPGFGTIKLIAGAPDYYIHIWCTPQEWDGDSEVN